MKQFDTIHWFNASGMFQITLHMLLEGARSSQLKPIHSSSIPLNSSHREACWLAKLVPSFVTWYKVQIFEQTILLVVMSRKQDFNCKQGETYLLKKIVQGKNPPRHPMWPCFNSVFILARSLSFLWYRALIWFISGGVT